jgi:hypothetical protein
VNEVVAGDDRVCEVEKMEMSILEDQKRQIFLLSQRIYMRILWKSHQNKNMRNGT